MIFLMCCSEGHMRGVQVHHSNDIHGVCECGCGCVMLLRTDPLKSVSEGAGFTQRLCHTSPIQLIARQRLLPDRQGLILDLCVIKYLFGKISQGSLERNGDNPLLKSETF